MSDGIIIARAARSVDRWWGVRGTVTVMGGGGGGGGRDGSFVYFVVVIVIVDVHRRPERKP